MEKPEFRQLTRLPRFIGGISIQTSIVQRRPVLISGWLAASACENWVYEIHLPIH
jgi:hypothetical protein